MIPALSASLLILGSALAQPPADHPLLAELAAQVSADREHATDERLVAFGTRSSLSETGSETRGIGAARRWAAAQFTAMSQACGGCPTVETPSQTFTRPRLPC